MPQPRPPNVVFVLTDDQGYGDLGCHGNTVVRTPHIDRLHAEGVRFTDFHSGTTCAPTRSGLLTGRHCNSAGVWHTIGGRSLLRAGEWTLADALRSAGYRTGHFGKWHLGDTPPFRPHERGFQETVYHAGGGIGNTGDPWGNDYFDDTYFVNGTPRAFEGYCTDVFFREGLSFIERNAAGPFFCFIATNAPHTPLNVEPRYVEPYRSRTPHEDRARFYGMISNIDDNVGTLRARLRELDLERDTILVFMTDNGTASGVDLDPGGFPREGPGSFNAGMRGIKGSPYEGGHRVPFFLHYPAGGARGGRDIPVLASYVDFMPTILELCGVSIPAERRLHGMSLVPLVRGDDPAPFRGRTLITDTQRVARPVRWRMSAVMNDRWRLIGGRELYDLTTDPGQRHDIAQAHPEVVARLRRDYETWWETVSGQFEQDVPIEIGGVEETVKLTTHDVRNEACDTAWNQRQVRQGLAVSGYWEIDVRRAGVYRLELRRWPEETERPIAAGIEGDDVSWRRDGVAAADATRYRGGVALDIGWAAVSVGGQSHQQEIGPGQVVAEFVLELAEGAHHLYASFYDREERTITPYYVYVRRAPADGFSIVDKTQPGA